MRARGVTVAPMRPRVFLAAPGTILVVCLGAGLGMRASLTDYNSDPEVFGELDYEIACSTAAMVELVEPSEASGDIELGEVVLPSADNIEQVAPLIVVDTFNGGREYVNRAFACEIEVSRAVKGDGVSAGQTIEVLDSFWI